MNWKNRLTNYNFWISIVSAILLILQAFNFEFDIMYINEIATAVLGLLVVIGIINDPTRTMVKKEETNSEEVNKTNEIQENLIPKNIETEENVEDNNSIPSDEQNEIVDDNSKIDFESVVEKISSDVQVEKENLKDMLENLLNFFKNNEKTEEKTEISENIIEKEEVTSTENVEVEIKEENISSFNIVN